MIHHFFLAGATRMSSTQTQPFSITKAPHTCELVFWINGRYHTLTINPALYFIILDVKT